MNVRHLISLSDAPARPRDEAFTVSGFDLAESLIRRGADSARIAVTPGDEQPDWNDASYVPAAPYRFPWSCLVILPTYNESENVERMVAAVLRYLATDILIVDDNSPDGTGRIADALADAHEHIHVLHGEKKRGLGRAYIEGFRWALDRGYERVLETDCDFSHAPWDLPRLVHASAEAELVIGSRYVRGGSTVGWSFPRRMLSRAGNAYTSLFLGRGMSDWTAGFRCYHADLLRRLELGAVHANGYSFQIEMTWAARRAGAEIREIPIRFIDRERGKSKMDRAIAFEAVRLVPSLWLKGRA